MFEVGDKIMCTNIKGVDFVYMKRHPYGGVSFKKKIKASDLSTITVGNNYEVLKVFNEKFITIKCDDGCKRKHKVGRFVSLMDGRSIKIKKLKDKINEI